MKRLYKKKLTVIFFSLSLMFLIGQIAYGIYNNYISTKNEDIIISKTNTYSFFNIIKLDKENLENLQNFDSILPIENENKSLDIKSKIIEFIKKINV